MRHSPHDESGVVVGKRGPADPWRGLSPFLVRTPGSLLRCWPMSTTTNGRAPAPLTTLTAGDLTDELVVSLRQRLEQGQAHLAYLQGLADEQRAENQKMRRVIGILDTTPPEDRPRVVKKKQATTSHIGVKRANGTATGFGVSMETGEVYANKIIEIIDGGAEFVTQKEIYAALGHDQGKGSAAFKWLRSIGFLRNAGRDKETRRDRFKIMDREAVAKAMAATREGN